MIRFYFQPMPNPAKIALFLEEAGLDCELVPVDTTELGFGLEPASAVAEAIVAGIEADAFEVIRGGDARAQMIALHRENPAAIDQHLLGVKEALADAVRDRSAL